jgi:hypothetical protein
MVLAGPLTASAQPASFGQYLVVLDDSGSMDQADPRRLVEMAAAGLSAALEDGDQVMLVGLNELASGEAGGPAFVSPRDLLSGRDGGEGAAALAGARFDRIGRHDGQTPCRAALDRARSILNAVASAGAPQTLLMLTDGACNGGAVEGADGWLGSIRAHAERRFRFVLLMREGRERIDPALAEYSAGTGWTGNARVSFDSRALLRAFAEVLSFSRGLRYDDGGRIGLERTFAGASAVRVLAISDQGAERIALEHVTRSGASALAGGPTFRHATYGWSVRTARDRPGEEPYAIRSPTAGVDVLVIPVYGRLRIEAVVVPCGETPALPWSSERATRAGQPACAFARLVGDRGETIHPTHSFAFSMEACTDAGCAIASAMQPAADGTFNAQLGAEFPSGRHERFFRASGGALASPVIEHRGFSAMAFGVQSVALASEPARTLDRLDVGDLPKPTTSDVQLVVRGAFPAGASARLRCDVDADARVRECVTCTPNAETMALQDPMTVQLAIAATPFCPVVSEGTGSTPIRLALAIEPSSTDMTPHTFPIAATLRYATVQPIEIAIVAGETSTIEARVPAPFGAEVTVEASSDEGDVELAAPSVRLEADAEGRDTLAITTEVSDCCSSGTFDGGIVLRAGESSLAVPVKITVSDPGFWTCPGKQIAFFVALAVALGILFWIVRGFMSPATFGRGAVLMFATSHDGLLGLRDGDDGWRRLERFGECKRGFRRHAALHLGGPKAPLPSLKRFAADAYFEAQPGGGVMLHVKSGGLEKFDESSGWTEIPKGSHPVANRLTLRRGDETYLQFRR